MYFQKGLFILPVLLSSAFFARAQEAGNILEHSTSLLQTVDPQESQIEHLLREKRLDEALKLAASWKDEDQKSPVPWVVMARVSYEKGRYKKGLSYCRKALDLSPQYAPAYYWKGKIHESMKQPLEAANEWRAALLAWKGYAEAEEALKNVMVQIQASEDLPSSKVGQHP